MERRVRARKIVTNQLEEGSSDDDHRRWPDRSFNSDRMKVRFSSRQRRRIAIFGLKMLLCAVCLAYVIVPIAIIVFPQIERSMIFLTFVGWPWFVDYAHPETVGLSDTRNFFVESEKDIQLGAWHILPKSLVGSADNSNTFYELSLRKGLPVILYMHGNSGSRAGRHRVELYKVLRELDAHVIAFDYRGYADSTSVTPSEDGVVHDGKAMFHWLKERTGNSPLFVWGHSLGTGVATKAVSELCQEGHHPVGLVLESPFNNMESEVKEHPMARIFNFAPWFQWAVVRSLKANKLLFESDKHISGITAPIVVFHAIDDNIIPFDLGEKLYQAAVEGRPKSSSPVSMIVLDGNHGYGHRYICRAPELANTIRKFLRRPDEKI